MNIDNKIGCCYSRMAGRVDCAANTFLCLMIDANNQQLIVIS